MITFILNDRLIRTDRPAGLPLLDFIRYDQGLRGTKIGCREGDCGACLTLEGRLIDGALRYRSIVSCLTPLANAQGRHIVTVEGINGPGLNPVQQAIAELGATQCGFCTPGFVMALSGLCLSEDPVTDEQAIAALDGNLCRCTGYQSLREAALRIAGQLPAAPEARSLSTLAEKGFLPAYFTQIPERLADIPPLRRAPQPGRVHITGGTDLFVQRPDEVLDAPVNFLAGKKSLEKISFRKGVCTIGSAVTATDIARNPVLQQHFPRIREYFSLIASTPIRNMGALGGNIANASPIADMVIFFLALDADILLRSPQGIRQLPLKRFFLGYKKMDKTPDEHIEAIRFALPGPHTRFHFEKVSKRTYLDIASVNTAICLEMNGDTIARIGLSAGGVGPIPMFLTETCKFLSGKSLSESLLAEADAVMQQEISPISDIRGTAEYKRLLLRQLLYAHFSELFPERSFAAFFQSLKRF
jgi:xanthine dehydrogenase small subunit